MQHSRDFFRNDTFLKQGDFTSIYLAKYYGALHFTDSIQ